MTCKNCVRFDSCAKDDVTRYYGKEIAAGNVEDLCTRFSANKEATWRLETDEECPDPMFKLVECSNCKKLANSTYNFCPNCGSRMIRFIKENVKLETTEAWEQLEFPVELS